MSQRIGVSIKGVILGEDGKLLSIRRSETAPTRALGWDLPGGELDFGESPEDGMRREIREETGLEVADLKVFDAVSGMNALGEFWVTIVYVCKPKTSEVVLSYEHDDWKWVTPEEFLALAGLSDRQKAAVERLKREHLNIEII